MGMPPPGVPAQTPHSPYFEGDFMILALCCCQRKVNCSSRLPGRGCTSARAACAWHRLRLVPASTVGCGRYMHKTFRRTRAPATRGAATAPPPPGGAPLPTPGFGGCVPFPSSRLLDSLSLPQRPFVSLSVQVLSLTVFFLVSFCLSLGLCFCLWGRPNL